MFCTWNTNAIHAIQIDLSWLDLLRCKVTYWHKVLPVLYDLNQFSTVPERPAQFSSRLINILWSTVSKAKKNSSKHIVRETLKDLLQTWHSGALQTPSERDWFTQRTKRPNNSCTYSWHNIGEPTLQVKTQQCTYISRKRDTLLKTVMYTFWTEKTGGETTSRSKKIS